MEIWPGLQGRLDWRLEFMLYNISIHLSRLHKILLHCKQICGQMMESVRLTRALPALR